MPLGPDGSEGRSAYEVWVDEVNDGTIDWPKDQTDKNNWYLYLKGADGTDGIDGKSAYDLWLKDVANGIENPHVPNTNWPKDQTTMSDFWLFLTGAKGQNGATPNIGKNGHWWINGEDSGIPATGQPGADGHSPNVKISDDGFWIVDGVKTSMPARGTVGVDGKSAYDLWKAELADGGMLDKDGNEWPQEKNTINDFWAYLTGKDGEDGKNGVVQPAPEIGYYNVIAQYSMAAQREYVNWEDGSVIYAVYGTQANELNAGVKVRLRGVVNPSKIYITNEQGLITVPKEQLPTDGSSEIFVRAEVYVDADGDGTFEWTDTWDSTYIPYRMQMRLLTTRVQFHDVTNYNAPNLLWITYSLERRPNSVAAWERIPSYLGTVSIKHTIWPVALDGTKGAPLSLSLLDDIASTDVSAPLAQVRTRRLAISSSTIDITQVLKPEQIWTDNVNTKHLYVMGFTEYCYGEEVVSQTLFEDTPTQPMPLPSAIELSHVGGPLYNSNVVYGGDITSQVNLNLLYANPYVVNPSLVVPGYTECLSPTKVVLTAAEFRQYDFAQFNYNAGGTSTGVNENIKPLSLDSGIPIPNVILPANFFVRTIKDGNELDIMANFNGYGIGSISNTAVFPRPYVLKTPTVIVK